MSMFKNFFFDLYGTLVDIRTDEQKPSLWRDLAEFYSLCGASYNPGEVRERYLALCEEETAALAAACPILTAEDVEIELRNVFRRLFEEKDIAVSAARVEDTALLFRVLSFCSAPQLMEGAEKTLKGLRQRGARLYLLSNISAGRTPSAWKAAISTAGNPLRAASACRKAAGRQGLLKSF